MSSLGIAIEPSYSAAIAKAATALVHGRTPKAAVQAHALTDPLPRSSHGWVGIRFPDGRVWYIHVSYDAHGYEEHGRSRDAAPEGIEPSSIPMVDQVDDPRPVQRRLADALRLVRAHRDGRTVILLPAELAGVAEGEPEADRRLAALYRLETARATLADGHRVELLSAFLDSMRSVAPTPGGSRDLAPLREAAGEFLVQIERERADLTVDAAVAALIELFCKGIASADDVGAATIAAGFVAGLPIADDDVVAWLDRIMMMCRKTSDIGFLQRLAFETRERASAAIETALGAEDTASYVEAMSAACHAAWLSDSLHEHLARHRGGVPGLVQDPLFERSATVADELLVRTSRALVNWLEALRGAQFAVHRIGVLQRMRSGGRQAGLDWAVQLVEWFYYYPRAVLPLLQADDPGHAIEPGPDGAIPDVGLDAKVALLEAMGLVRKAASA